jgi:hypothetical protein
VTQAGVARRGELQPLNIRAAAGDSNLCLIQQLRGAGAFQVSLQQGTGLPRVVIRHQFLGKLAGAGHIARAGVRFGGRACCQ